MTKPRPAAIALSVVIPVHDAEATLPPLLDRLYPTLDRLGIPYELVLVDDASRDRSPTLLRQQHRLRGELTRVILLRETLGTAGATLAGCSLALGGRVLTLDAYHDQALKELPRLLAALDRGHDFVGVYRPRRPLPRWEGQILGALAWVRGRATGFRMRGLGAGPYGYQRALIERIQAEGDPAGLSPEQAYRRARDPLELEATGGHDPAPLRSHLVAEIDLIGRYARLRFSHLAVTGLALAAASGMLLVMILALGILGLGVAGMMVAIALLGLPLGLILLGVAQVGERLERLLAPPGQRPELIREHLRPRQDEQGTGD